MKDLMVANGKYKTKNGDEITEWVKIGVMADGQKGSYLLLEPHINIAAFKQEGQKSIMVSIFEQQKKEVSAADVAKSKPFDDDMPF